MKITKTEKCVERVKKLILKFIKEENDNLKGSEFENDLLMSEDLKKCVFLREEDSIIISGEDECDFSSYYVNYYEGMELASNFMAWMNKHGVHLEWENPACMIYYDGDEL